MTIVQDSTDSQVADRQELLPFRIRLATSPKDLERAVEIRAAAYSRHLPHVGEALRTAEAEDYRSDVLVLIAERKFDRRPIGTLRLEPNFKGPLRIEGERTLPERFRGRRLVETSRLGVENGSTGTMVMVALVKAAFEICRACEVDHTISVGRRSMAEVFRSMCFDALEGPVQLSYSKTTPFWIFSALVRGWEDRLEASGHAHFEFIARTTHPDIAIDYDTVFKAFGWP